MVPEDGVIWIYRLDVDHNAVAFSEEGVDALRKLIEMHREDEQLISPRSLTWAYDMFQIPSLYFDSRVE